MFLLSGALLILDVVFHYCDVFKVNIQVMFPVEVLCKLTITVTCFWVFVCNANVRRQLKAKYPQGIGRFLKAEDRRKTVAVLWKEKISAFEDSSFNEGKY